MRLQPRLQCPGLSWLWRRMRIQFVGVSKKNCVQTAEDAVMLPFIPPAKPPRLLLRAAEVCAGVPLAKHFKRVCQSELLLVL